MLVAREVKPSQIGPCFLRRRASAQSSMISAWIASIEPAAANAVRRTSMHPPAAAAVLVERRLTQENGNSMAKKNTNAGIRNFSAALSQDSFAISDTRAKFPVSAREASCERL